MEKVNLVKIGSNSVTEENLKKVILDAKKWEAEKGEKFIFVLSGAVKFGKEAILTVGDNIENFSKSSQASIGQSYLMEMMNELSGKNKLCAQILLDDYAHVDYITKIGMESSRIGKFLGKYNRPSCLIIK